MPTKILRYISFGLLVYIIIAAVIGAIVPAGDLFGSFALQKPSMRDGLMAFMNAMLFLSRLALIAFAAILVLSEVKKKAALENAAFGVFLFALLLYAGGIALYFGKNVEFVVDARDAAGVLGVMLWRLCPVVIALIARTIVLKLSEGKKNTALPVCLCLLLILGITIASTTGASAEEIFLTDLPILLFLAVTGVEKFMKNGTFGV